MPGGLGTAGGEQGGWYLIQSKFKVHLWLSRIQPNLLSSQGAGGDLPISPDPYPPLPNTPICYPISPLPLLIEPLCSKLLYSLFPLSQMLLPIWFTSSLPILNLSSQRGYSCLPNINPPSCHLWPLNPALLFHHSIHYSLIVDIIICLSSAFPMESQPPKGKYYLIPELQTIPDTEIGA